MRKHRLELLRRIENYKRVVVRRVHQLAGDSPDIVQALDRYDRYRKMLVRELYRPWRMRNCIDRNRQQMFRSLVAIAEAGLKEAKSRIPPDKQLRKLVSQWIQDVRRYRSQITISTLLCDPPAGKEYLVKYIQHRWGKIDPAPKTDLSTRQAAVGEALRKVVPDLDGDD
jgi:hypothetical protein